MWQPFLLIVIIMIIISVVFALLPRPNKLLVAGREGVTTGAAVGARPSQPPSVGTAGAAWWWCLQHRAHLMCHCSLLCSCMREWLPGGRCHWLH